MTTTMVHERPGSLHIGSFGAGVPPRNKDSWKALVGQKRVPARLSLLADPKPRVGSFGLSVMMQCVGVILLITIPMLFPQKLIPIMRYSVIPLATPQTDVPLPPEPPKPPKMKVVKVEKPPEPVVEPPKVAKIYTPPKPVMPKPKPKELAEQAAPKIDTAFTTPKVDLPKNEPSRPRPPVETGLMSTGSAAVPTLPSKVRPEQVQTGGFGDPNGVAGKGDPNKRANVNQKGALDLPGGPGYGNGTGGANGVRGTVASTGFGNGVAVQPPSSGRRGAVQSTGFSDASKVVDAPKKAAAPSTSPVQPVEILAKPRPLYSDEARALKLEGEVLIDVVFGANGQVQINRIIRGLGHGLDESAVRAAQQIRYKPALRDGQPVDFPATVHIVFQLAY